MLTARRQQQAGQVRDGSGEEKIVAEIDSCSRPPGQPKGPARRHQGQAGKMQCAHRGFWRLDRSSGPQQCICSQSDGGRNGEQKSGPEKKPGGIECVMRTPSFLGKLHRGSPFRAFAG
ncbi:MAG: hypothetical protein K9L59_18210 [Desulfobacterales bacterium]|nr:hypothetical protein [Desulfobacterales bacterium]